MITRKHLFFTIAATCLLTTFLFGVVPIRSAGYDPSLDENHDGKIDGRDIALPALIYGTAGDPTVPVNVTNWDMLFNMCDCKLHTKHCFFGNYASSTLTPGQWFNSLFVSQYTAQTSGYSKIYLYLWINGTVNASYVWVDCSWSTGGPFETVNLYPNVRFYSTGTSVMSVFEFDVIGQAQFSIGGQPIDTIDLQVGWYVTA